MKIFITGGTGFVGKHFLEYLGTWPKDATFYVLTRAPIVFNDPRIVPVVGDVRDVAAYKDILQSVDYVFHLAANVNFFNGTKDDDAVNFESTKALVDHIKLSPTALKNFVFISTIGAVDRHPLDRCREPLTVDCTPAPSSQYGMSKLKSEDYIRASGLPFTIIRPTWVYGAKMRAISHINSFVSMVYNHNPICHVNFPGKVSLIYVGDLVASFAACIDNPTLIGKTYFAATESRTIGELFATIYAELHGKKPWQTPIPRFMRTLVSAFHHRIPLTVANLFVDYLYADTNDFMKDFNVQHPVPFNVGVQEVIATNGAVSKQVKKYSQIGFGALGTALKHSLYPVAFFKEIIPAYGTLLDFGCGEGMLANLLAQNMPNLSVIGIDKDPHRIQQAQKVASTNARFVCDTIQNCTVTNARAVLINDVLHHQDDATKRAIVRKVHQCLVPGGIFILKDVDRNDWADNRWTRFWDTKLYPHDTLSFLTPDEWKNLIVSEGFEFSKQHRVKHFWPASRTIQVYIKK